MECRKAGDMTMDGVRGRLKLKSSKTSLDPLIQGPDQHTFYTVM